jgi:VanZ family protein
LSYKARVLPNQPVPASARLALRHAWLALGWAGVAAIVYLSLMPDPPDLGVEQGDKLEHVAAYGCLMFWFAQVFVARTSRWTVGLALVALGVALEFAQRATGYRTFSVADMGAGALGVLLGAWLAPPRTPSRLDLAERWLRTTREV